MTREEAKKYLPLIQAFAEGKTIQFRNKITQQWNDINIPAFELDREYRIKPEPKLRPWKPEEVPVGMLIRNKDRLYNARTLILATSDRGILKFGKSSVCPDVLDFDSALANYEHSTDSGKTWHPCGVLEESEG